MGKAILFLALGLGACWLIGNILKVIYELSLLIYKYSSLFLIIFVIFIWHVEKYKSMNHGDNGFFILTGLVILAMLVHKKSSQKVKEKTEDKNE